MAVETRYVVIDKEGREVKTFTDKKAADEYDRMLEIADEVTLLLENAPVELSESDREELAVYLAKQREELAFTLGLKRRPKPKAQAEDEQVEAADPAEEAPAAKSRKVKAA